MISDYEAILACVQNYIEGEINADADVEAKAFAEDATIHGAFGDHVWGGPIQMLFDVTASEEAKPEMKVRADILDMHETVAVVRVVLEDPNGPDYVDYHSLVKGPDGWKIYAKVFHAIMPAE